MAQLGSETTTDDVLADTDLTGVSVFITGGNSGLGKETGRAMAARGADVMLAGRDQTKLDEAVASICADTPEARIETIVCDLASLASVRECSTEAQTRLQKIDLLINNAGVMACPFSHTADGFEAQFGTNHLGHFALTAGLFPLIEAGSRKRIVNLSSRGHHIAPFNPEDPHFAQREYDRWVSYGQSKTANVLFTAGLEARFADRGIHAYAVHPGGIQTNLGRHLTEEMVASLMDRVSKGSGGFSWKSIPQGAATQCWAATAQTLEGRGGVYCEDCHVAEVDDDSPESGVRSYALDQDMADRLWSLSEAETGAEFTPR